MVSEDKERIIDENDTREQAAAIGAAEGSWLVAAGAGSGKTRVVTRRFVRLLQEEDTGIDQILTITFTRKAAGHMMKKIRKLLKDEGFLEERRRIERARISTIHSFCSSVVRSNCLALGIDPGFTVAEEAQADIIRLQAFDDALEALTSSRDGGEAVEMIAAYEPGRRNDLFKAISSLHSKLRCRGQETPTFDIPVVRLAQLRDVLRQETRHALAVMDEGGQKAPKTRVKMDALLESTIEDDHQKAVALLTANVPQKGGFAKDAITAADEARLALLKAHRSILAIPQLKILRRLLEGFSNEYARAKRSRGLLDFEDLELFTARLFEDDPPACQALAAGFRFIMVDEFQDTNELQNRIIERISRDNVFFVGDVNQSIYRFRNADVSLFRKKKDITPEDRLLKLPANFRSQKEILDFIDHLFSGDQMLPGDSYIKLEAGAEQLSGKEPFRVEVVLVDGDSDDRNKVNKDVSRTAEAELIAARLAELERQGRFTFGEMTILLRASPASGIVRAALDRAGIPNYLSIGRDFYKQLEFGDALCLLDLLVNPLNDIALLTVLRSPMVGISDDTLYWLRQVAGRRGGDLGRPLWSAVGRKELKERIPDKEWESLDAFSTTLADMQMRSRRQPLDVTMREVVGYNDYAAALAAGYKGRQAYANLMKLVDKAAEFEQAEGRDLQALARFLEHQQAQEVAETEAPLEEEEGGGAVRIMTIHSAKGLEFPLVVWADMSYKSKEDNDMIICCDGRIGLRHKVIGSKEPDLLFDYKELKAHDDELDLEEEKRIGYVAMTRAEKHLILCGTSNLDKSPLGPQGKIPIEWVRQSLSLEAGDADFDDARAVFDKDVFAPPCVKEVREGLRVGLTLCPEPEAVIAACSERAFRGGVQPVAAVRPDLSVFPPAVRFVPAQLSASSLDTYMHAPCRFYVENLLRLDSASLDEGEPGLMTREDEEPAVAAGGMDSEPAGNQPAGSGNLSRSEMGTLVHAVLETELSSLETVDDYALERIASLRLRPGITLNRADYTSARELLRNFSDSPVARDLIGAARAGKLERELPFSLLAGETIIKGKIDAIFPLERSNGRLVVVDYKTGAAGRQTPEELAGHYRMQMMCYGLAASKLGAKEVEIVLAFLEESGREHHQEMDHKALKAAEESLADLIGSMERGVFPKLESFDPYYCLYCAGRTGKHRLCS